MVEWVVCPTACSALLPVLPACHGRGVRSSHCLCHLSLSFWVGKELVEKKSSYNDDLFASSFCMPHGHAAKHVAVVLVSLFSVIHELVQSVVYTLFYCTLSHPLSGERRVAVKRHVIRCIRTLTPSRPLLSIPLISRPCSLNLSLHLRSGTSRW